MIKSINVGGTYTKAFEVMEFLGYGFTNTVEIVFKDDSSESLDVKIYRNDLDLFALKIRQLVSKLEESEAQNVPRSFEKRT
jgi:hypothetical protein